MHSRGTPEGGHEYVLEAFRLLGPVARPAGIAGGLLEICDCTSGIPSPVPQHSGKAECTRKHRLIAEFLEDGDHALQVLRYFLVAQLGHSVHTEVGTRDGGIGGHKLVSRCQRNLDCLRQHRIGAL